MLMHVVEVVTGFDPVTSQVVSLIGLALMVIAVAFAGAAYLGSYHARR